MKAIEFLHETFDAEAVFGFMLRPRAYCADGYSISIQGGTAGHLCQPRRFCDEYERVELGYPNGHDDILIAYAYKTDRAQTETFFPYVPIEVVEQLIAKHGGIVEYK